MAVLCFGLAGRQVSAAPPLPKCETPQTVRGSPPEVPTRASSSLRVVSMNLHGQSDWEVVAREVKASPDLAAADVLLLQEVKQDGPQLLAAASEDMNFHFLFAPNQDWGLAILSRFPLMQERVLLLPQNDLRYNSRCRIALVATAQTDSGSLSLVNVHLDTRINSSRRIRQLKPVLEAARQSQVPTVIGGDFNTANFLWIRSVIPLPFLQCQACAVRKAMERDGFTTPFRKTGATFGFPPMKLDWIFLKGLTAQSRGLVELPFSDHKALWTVVE